MIITSDSESRVRLSVQTALNDLCEAILAQDGVISARREVDTFFDNAEASQKYTSLAQLGSALHRKQHGGEVITDAEERQYQKLHTEAMADAAVLGFLQAKEGLENIQSMVNAYVSKTIELGRVPEADDFQSSGGCCGGSGGSGGGCGC
jgi:cell fate (sporulation/competence/biofilm development) regulator YlbF (YheA/YmcA/DUF963 family)